jgi:4-hydroxymandelate oxidase
MDTNKLTEEYFNKIVFTERLINSKLADIHTEIFSKSFSSPIFISALSHLDAMADNGLANTAKAAKENGVIDFLGMSTDEQIESISATGTDFISIIKPVNDQKEIIRQIEHARNFKALAVGCDIDHAYNSSGAYDNVNGTQCVSKSVDEIRELVYAAGDLPFIVKGVLSVDDAVSCVEAGVKGIVVSSHHGIMDSLIPPLMILPEIKEAVGDRMVIFVDGSVSNGYDAFKAMALGADAVLLGRAIIPALQKEGTEGVSKVLKKISGEFKAAMSRTGYSSIKEIDSSCLRFIS